jgi:hypothetical protein
MSGQSTQSALKKAMLIEVKLTPNQAPQEVDGGKQVEVDFNPQTLKLTYSNENKSANQPSGSASQFVGAGTSKLAIELLFDTSQDGSDVRAVTSDVAYFIRSDPSKAQQSNQPKRVPPGCRFEWGTFRFDGVVDSLQETLDYFSEDGVPLRSTLSLGISGIDTMLPQQPAAGAPATTPQTQAPANTSMQQLAGANGNSAGWKSIAAANNIDDPLHLTPGTMIDMSAGASVSAGVVAGASAGTDVGFTAGLGGGVGFAAGISAGFGASAGVSANASAGAGAGAGINLGVGASTGVGASAGLGLSAGIGGSVGVSGSTAVAIGARTNAAGSAGGSFGISATASAGA